MDPRKLISSNWMQDGRRGVVLFRPVADDRRSRVIGAAFDDPEMRLATAAEYERRSDPCQRWIVLSVVRQRRGVDHLRDVIFVAAFLFSGSAVIAAGWFANGFDAMAFFLSPLPRTFSPGEWLECRSIGRFGLLFAKRSQCSPFPFILVLAWMEQLDRKETKRALLAAGIALVLFLVLRSVIVAPGSESDLRQLASGGTLSALLRLPLTFWWQGADVPVSAGWELLPCIASLVLMKRWQATRWSDGVVAVTAALYGPIIRLGP